ncbi:CCR4-NOT transcription complex subunit 11 [Histomonas meleagridis]|uniref:CCR4-NOT transcription complex subunit 11 n=1 Tax=Histomonas meleagridis TaxID=135588 RepID=UPI00355A1F24|nr:CCR4-NOT transcription complex subunit 11 [Histomonas meleagridis]KAH0801965.1 CCR4-NOT transcription complex subunit 11 [Histomonas meleagridis]
MEPKETHAILSILNNEDRKLADIFTDFTSSLSFGERVSALTALSLLLTDGLLDHKQQVVATYFLYRESQVKDISNHPFFSVFQYISDSCLSDPNLYSPQLQELTRSIINSISIESIGSLSIQQIFSPNFSFSEVPNPKEQTLSVDTSHIRISPVIVMREENDSDNVMDHNQVLIEILQDQTFWNNFEAPLFLPAPNLSPIFEDEVSLINSFDNPPFIFDEGVTVGSRSAAIALINKATEFRLRCGESDSLITELKKDSTLVEEINLQPSGIQFLIENNTEVAKEVINILSSNNQNIPKILLNLDLTVASIDVVTSYILSGHASDAFLNEYISTTVNTILGIRDNQTMFRKARMFCKMMGFIIQNNRPLSTPMVINLNSLCEDNRTKSIKEAQELNTLLLNSP